MDRNPAFAARAHRPSASAWFHRLTGDINRPLLTVAIVAGVLFALLTILVVAHPAPFFFDRPIEVAVQSVRVGPFGWFNTFVSAFSGFVGIGVGAAVIAITFLVRRPATPLVAFSAIYAAVYNGVNIIVQQAPTDRRGTHDLETHRLQLSKRACGILRVVDRTRDGAPCPQSTAPHPLHRLLDARSAAGYCCRTEPHLRRGSLAERCCRRPSCGRCVDLFEPFARAAHDTSLSIWPSGHR